MCPSHSWTPSLMHRSRLDPRLSLSGGRSEPPARQALPRRPLRSTDFCSVYIPACAPEGTQQLSPSPTAAEGRDQHAHPQVYMKTLPETVASTDPWITPALGDGWGSGAHAPEAWRQRGGQRKLEVTGTGLSSPPFQQWRAPVPTPLPGPRSGGTMATKGSEGACPTPWCLVVPEPTWSSGSCTASPRGRSRVESVVLAVPEGDGKS